MSTSNNFYDNECQELENIVYIYLDRMRKRREFINKLTKELKYDYPFLTLAERTTMALEEWYEIHEFGNEINFGFLDSKMH